MKKTLLSLAMLAIATPTLLTSCATIFGKSSYPVSINSNPVGANISITDKKNKEIFKGQTPTTVTLKSGAGYFSKAEYQLKISSAGFSEQIIPINFKMNAWYFGNIPFVLGVAGFLGALVIDPVTGAMWKLDTPPINVTLSKSTTSIENPTIKIIDIASVPEEMKAKLIRIK